MMASNILQAEDGLGSSLFPPAIESNTRNILLEITGVDVWFLASVNYPSPYRKKAIWRLHGMHCDVCGRSWKDGIRLARHHKIPLRLCRLLGLSKAQSWNESNMTLLCEEHHDEADKRLRVAISEKIPDLYCWMILPGE